MRVRWTRPAREDLVSAGEYVAERDPVAAVRMAARIQEQTGALSQFPMRGRAGRVPGTRELVIVGTPYVVTYELRADGIAIVGFLHGRQSWPSEFE